MIEPHSSRGWVSTPKLQLSQLKLAPLKLTQLKLIPFIVLGGVVFVVNSHTNLNYLFRGYFTLLEAQIGILVLYLLMTKLTKKPRKNS